MFVFLILLIGNAVDSFSQPPGQNRDNSLETNTEVTDTNQVPPFLPIPGRAAMLSAALPGLGQAYNRAYWKIPIIYAGFAGVAFAVNFNNTHYQTWRSAFIAKVDGNPNTIDLYPAFSDAALRRVMEFYRRNLELSYIAGVALYLLNILDANVQAHLMDFDVGEDLTMRLSPSVSAFELPGAGSMSAPGLKLTLRF
ncbi:MAG TPA: DUF5683 domain-containing protein [Bacteroidales bacterium]|nr:DUF5683 domain-containing protein [Bacteroidales bacterium]